MWILFGVIMGWKTKESQVAYMKKYRVENRNKMKEYQKQYDIKNREKIRRRKRAYCAKRKEKIRIYAQKYRQSHPAFREHVLQYNREYREKHRASYNAWARQYRKDNIEEKRRIQRKGYLNNKEKYNARQRRWEKNKMKSDALFAILKRTRRRIRQAVKVYCDSVGKIKYKSTKELIGCPIDEFVAHLSKPLNPGQSILDFHIDHIRPLASFNLSIPGELEKAFHWSNTQLLPPEENIKKGSVWNGVRHGKSTLSTSALTLPSQSKPPETVQVSGVLKNKTAPLA
jgi:hypothetical protein